MNSKNFYKKFWEDGYVIIPNFLSNKRIKKIFYQINELINQTPGEKKNNSYKISDLNKKYLSLKKNNPKLKSHFYDLTKYCDSVISCAGSKKFLKYAKLFLNTKTTLIDNLQVKVDHPKESLNLPEHQELNNISRDVITFYIPLVNIDKKMGGIYFRPKSHKLGHIKYKNSNISAQKAGKMRKIILKKFFSKPGFTKYKHFQPKLKAGDAVAFHTFLFHGTNPNLSNKIRWTYIVRYNSPNTPYLKNKNATLRIPYTADYNSI